MRRVLGPAHARTARAGVMNARASLRVGDVEDIHPGVEAGEIYTACGHVVLTDSHHGKREQPSLEIFVVPWRTTLEQVIDWVEDDSSRIVTVRCRTQGKTYRGITVKRLLQALALGIPFFRLQALAENPGRHPHFKILSERQDNGSP